MNGSTHSFSIGNTNEIIMNNSVEIFTNISLFTPTDFQRRFFADIIKDGNTDPKIVEIVPKLQNLYNDNVNIPPPGNSYHTFLDQLEKTVFDKPIIKKNVDELTNVLRTSTIGSNTRISDAEFVFRESGNSPDSICRKQVQVLKIVETPASLLDSAGKGDSNMYFPNSEVEEIIFDKLFTFRLGFPDELVWKTKHNNNNNYNVSITDKTGVNLESDINLYTKSRGGFEQYILGNNIKNTKINEKGQLVDNHTKILLLIKELGDVAQVWMYFAFVSIYFNDNREKCVMITTDSVVYLFCTLLHISCVYTGARKGVDHGCCTIKHYLAGPVNYEEMLKNKVEIEYNHVMNNIFSIQNSLNRIIREIYEVNNIIWFYCVAYGRRNTTKIFLNRNTLHPVELNWCIITIREQLLDIIDAKKKELERIYDGFKREFDTTIKSLILAAAASPTDSAAIVDSNYKNFLKLISIFMLPQIVTKHSNNTISLNNVALDQYNFLQEFVNYHNEQSFPEQRGKMIPIINLLNKDQITQPIVDVIAGPEERMVGGAHRGGAMPLKNDNTYVFEFKVIYYIITKDFFSEGLVLDNILNNYLEKEKLAVLYDLYANDINREAFNSYTDGQTPILNEIDTKLKDIDKDEINYAGLKVSEFIDFESVSEDRIDTHYEVEATNIYLYTKRAITAHPVGESLQLRNPLHDKRSHNPLDDKRSRNPLRSDRSLGRGERDRSYNPLPSDRSRSPPRSYRSRYPILSDRSRYPHHRMQFGFGGKKNKTKKNKPRKNKPRKNKTRKNKPKKNKNRKTKNKKQKTRKRK